MRIPFPAWVCIRLGHECNLCKLWKAAILLPGSLLQAPRLVQLPHGVLDLLAQLVHSNSSGSTATAVLTPSCTGLPGSGIVSGTTLWPLLNIIKGRGIETVKHGYQCQRQAEAGPRVASWTPAHLPRLLFVLAPHTSCPSSLCSWPCPYRHNSRHRSNTLEPTAQSAAKITRGLIPVINVF